MGSNRRVAAAASPPRVVGGREVLNTLSPALSIHPPAQSNLFSMICCSPGTQTICCTAWCFSHHSDGFIPSFSILDERSELAGATRDVWRPGIFTRGSFLLVASAGQWSPVQGGSRVC